MEDDEAVPDQHRVERMDRENVPWKIHTLYDQQRDQRHGKRGEEHSQPPVSNHHGRQPENSENTTHNAKLRDEVPRVVSELRHSRIRVETGVATVVVPGFGREAVQERR